MMTYSSFYCCCYRTHLEDGSEHWPGDASGIQADRPPLTLEAALAVGVRRRRQREPRSDSHCSVVVQRRRLEQKQRGSRILRAFPISSSSSGRQIYYYDRLYLAFSVEEEHIREVQVEEVDGDRGSTFSALKSLLRCLFGHSTPQPCVIKSKQDQRFGGRREKLEVLGVLQLD
jgi:hypothetical protein